MSHRDSRVRLKVVCLRQCLRWLLAGVDWSPIGLRDDCGWTPRSLASAALLWAWSDELTLTERFRTVRRITACLDGGQRQLAGSYQAFTKILRRWTDALSGQVIQSLRKRTRETLPDCWRTAGRVLFGVDGSRLDLPRTRSHEKAYSSARHRRKKNRRGQRLAAKDVKKVNSPQLWITTLWHAGTGLPWDWRLGPADSSERGHLSEMLAGLPERAMIAADAGFVGYGGLRQITDQGLDLLVRVGANVRLLRKLGWVRERAGTVSLWPDRETRRRQPPLTLRLVVAHNGKHPVYLVTSVLSPRELTDRQVIELYAKRWGIELFYRHLKQTFGRRKLLSTSAANALVEAQWSLVGLWAMALYALVEAVRCGVAPQRLSFAKLLLAFRRTMRDYLHPAPPDERLCQQLRQAIIDDYQRKNKQSRDYPRKKQEKPPGAPEILTASRTQVQTAATIKREQKGLTA